MHFGILGAAHIARDAVGPAIVASEHTVHAVASRDAERAQAFAAEVGAAQAYDDYDALLADEDVDAVYVPLPNGLHAHWTKAAADEGLHVLCEKPLAVDAEEAADVVAHCEAAGVTLMEAFMYVCHPRTERALAIAADELGPIRHVEATFTFPLGDRPDDVRLQPDLAGGALRDVGCYAVDVARRILGEPERAGASTVDRRDAGVDTHVAGRLEFADGATAHVTGGFDAAHVEAYRVLGADGWLEARQAFGGGVEEPVEVRWRRTDGEEHVERFDPVDHYRLEVEAFAAAVEDGTPLPVTHEDTLATLRAMDALAQSGARETAVSVPATPRAGDED